MWLPLNNRYLSFHDQDSCKELQVNATSQEECFVYQAKVTSGVLAGSSADVMDYMVSQLQGSGDDDDDGSGGGGTAPVTLNSPYRVQFLGIPQSDSSTQAGGGEDGRNNLGTPPTSVKESSVERQSSSQGRGDTITVVGGILMAAFCLLFVAICVIIHRRRQEWLRERAAGEGGDDPDATGGPSKNAYRNGTVKVAADDANNYYGARDLHSDLCDEDEHLQMDGKGGVLRRTAPGDDDGVDREKITIDMGCNFKDQLMGVYYGSSSAAAQQQQQRRLQQQQLGGLYGNGRATSMDSEADSWAQTDGTIGSIEQNLEPITSEV